MKFLFQGESVIESKIQGHLSCQSVYTFYWATPYILSTNFKKINREKVQIFLPIGKCLPAFLVLFQVGQVCAKKSSLRIWSMKFKIY
jgi:hypothetical protein